MKKLFVALLLVAVFITVEASAGVIATYPRKALFIEKMIYSPDGKKIALQARDKANYYKRNASIYIGKSRYGRFRKISSVSVSNITWIDNNTIAFRDKNTGSISNNKKPAIVVKAINIRTRRIEMIYSLPAQIIPGSGGQTAVTNLHAISPGARYILVQIGKQYIIEDMVQRRPVTLRNFTVPYSFNPPTQVRFFGRDGVILYDGNARRYMIYRYDGRGLRLQQTISRIKNLQPSADFAIDNGGKSILFAAEVCRGGCRYEIYKYNLASRSLSRKLRTVRGSQVLRMVFPKKLNRVLANDFHRWLKEYPIPAR